MHVPLLRPVGTDRPVLDTSIAEPPDLPPIRSNIPGSFAWGVLHQRHPELISQIRHAHPYLPEQHRALDDLLDEITTGPIRALDRAAPDHAAWDALGSGYLGQRWADVPFLWAESYFYRKLLDAVGFFTPGSWFWLDPFAFLKTAELHDPALEVDLLALDEVRRLPAREQTGALLLASVWGNRADLGFRIGTAAASAAGSAPGSEQPTQAGALVADDSAAVWAALQDGAARKLCVVCDNAGRELLADLILADHLLDAGLADAVVLHVKPHPYYVSDAVTADLVACLRRLAAAPGSAGEAARRLWKAMREGRVTVATHWFYCAPLSFHHLPPDLADELAAMSLVVLKGDLNYRRLVGDCTWPPTTPFSKAASYYPAPVVALRTLKSDVVVGLDADTVSTLDASGTAWRTSGTHALVQARL